MGVDERPTSLVLGLDAATPPASVALVRGEHELAHRTGPFGPKTDAWILAAVDEMLRETGTAIGDLDCIAAGCGPGTFTGIRVALAAGLGLGAGSGVAVCGISTLDALVEAAQEATGRMGTLDVLAVIDARRQQHYMLRTHAVLRPTKVAPTAGPAAVSTDALLAGIASDPPAVCIGAELELPPMVELLQAPPLAIAIARIAARMSAPERPDAVPTYLRAPDAVAAVSPLRRGPL
jgi:tRNA threonylcarbamoyl adenosine modification protein YeaZ